jgi:hypothetical protein
VVRVRLDVLGVPCSPELLDSSHVCGDVLFRVVHANVLETFLNFYHGIHIRYDNNSTSFMIFGIRSHFI